MKALCCACLALAACTFDVPVLEQSDRASSLSAAVRADNLLPWVEQLASEHLGDTPLPCADYPEMELYPSCALTSGAARELVRGTLEELGYEVKVLRHGAEPDAPVNLEAELVGTKRPHEAVVIAAHFDAFYGGADDNSSGVAALLELARVAAGRRFERTVRFVGFDLEERGSLGSTRYVEAGHANDAEATIVLECIGFTDRAGQQDAPFGLQLGDVADSLLIAANDDSRSMAQLLFALNNALRLIELRAVIAGGDGAFPLSGALLRSDNGPFWLKGLPAVMLTDSANYRNPHYHKASDTPETLDSELLASTTRLVAAALAELAGVEP